MKDKIIAFFVKNKIHTVITALLLALCIIVVSVFAIFGKKFDKATEEKGSDFSETINSSEESSLVESVIVSQVESQPVISEVLSDLPSSSQVISSSKPVVSSTTTSSKNNNTSSSIKPNKVTNNNFTYNTNTDIENNVFLDSLVYTGYNIKKHRADNLMWVYILASQKRAKGWLSKIGYGGGSTGYEVNKKGLPDIAKFERGGLVCASYVTYVYFNYLPNVAGIDTSSLAKPADPHLANSWYKAAQKWVKNGQAKYIKYSDKYNGIKSDVVFKELEKIPIGSIICFQDYYKKDGHCSHVAIYAGTANNYHWVFHVGNDNGPEFCAIERMNRDPDPQRLLAIISTPTNIRFSPKLQVELKDETGAPIKGVSFALKDSNGKTTIKTGKTNDKGILNFNVNSYGSYTIVQTVPAGYTTSSPIQKINLTTKNNSLNVIKITDSKIPPVVSEEEESNSQSNISSNVEVDSSIVENSSANQ